jgi:tetratricopeptide (TPR) repeat protein
VRGLLAFLYYRSGDRERAQPLAQDSVERARKLGDDFLLVRALVSYIATVDAAAAAPLFEEAIACSERAGYLIDYYVLHNNAGCNALELGDISSARAHLEAAIRAAQVMGHLPIYATNKSGRALLADHDIDGARRAFEDTIRIGRHVGAKLNIGTAILGLACLAADMGEWRRAATLHGAAKALHDQTGIRWEVTISRQRAESLDQIAAAIGDEQLERAYARGAALSFDHAIEIALGKSSLP